MRSKGSTYYYHRATKARLKAEFGTPEFDAEIRSLDLLTPQKTAPNSLGALIDLYLASPEFTSELAPRTRVEYQTILGLVAGIRPMPLSVINGGFLLKLRDKIFKKHRRRRANYVLQVLSLVFSWGLGRDHVVTNPALGVPHLKLPKNHVSLNRPWKVDEFYKVLGRAQTATRIAVAFGGYAGVSEGDVLLLGPKNLITEQRELVIATADGEKTVTQVVRILSFIRKKTGVKVHQELHPELVTVLKVECVGDRYKRHLVARRDGDGYTEDGFRANLRKVIQALIKEGEVDKGLTFHGLRHFVGTTLATNGADNKTIMAILGQKTAKMAELYSEEFDRKTRGNVGSGLLRKALNRGGTEGQEN